MSYDVSLKADCGGPYPITLDGTHKNYTYNLGPFFSWFLGKGLTDFDGEEAWILQQAIEQGFEKFRGKYKEDPPSLDFLKSFEPENRWGSVLGAINFLFEIHRSCLLAPEAKVSVD